MHSILQLVIHPPPKNKGGGELGCSFILGSLREKPEGKNQGTSEHKCISP